MNFICKKLMVYTMSTLLVVPMNLFVANAAGVSGTVYKNGKIYTMTDTIEEAKSNSHSPNMVEVVVTENGKIIYAGSESGANNYIDGKKVVDLEGRTMLPGFIDGHGHFPGFATTDLYNVNLYPTPIGNTDTIEELVAKLKEKADATPATTYGYTSLVTGMGYDDTLLDASPNADHLAGASTDKYIEITHISGHLAVVNRLLMDAIMDKDKMIAQSKIRNAVAKTPIITDVAVIDGVYTLTYESGVTEAFSGVIMQNGVPTGLLNETQAMGLADYFSPTSLIDTSANNKEYTSETNAKNNNIMAYASRTYAAAGVTNANQSISMMTALPTYRDHIANDRLNIRVTMHPAAFYQAGNTELGGLSRMLLGWEGVQMFFRDTPASEVGAKFGTVATIADGRTEENRTRIVGDDITRWDPSLATGGKSSKVMSEADLAAAGYSAEQIAKLDGKLFLGQHKLLFDGSNQGYTGYFKQPGYYNLNGDPNHPQKPNDPNTEKTPDTQAFEAGLIKLYDPTDGCAHMLLGAAGTLTNTPFDKLNELVYGYISQDQGLTIHSNGSWGNEVTLAAIERSVWEAYENGLTPTDTRNTIIHAQMQERQHTQRLAGIFDDINAQEAGSLPVEYIDLEGFANPNMNYSSYVNVNPFDGTYQLEAGAEYTESDRAQLANYMKEQNNVSSYYVDHTYYWGHRHKTIFMGPGRAQQISPLGWAVAYDHHYTTHNDTPIVPVLPLRSMEAATTRIPFGQDYALSGTSKDLNATVMLYDLEPSRPEAKEVAFWDYDQRVNVLQALRALTINSAYSTKTENVQGTIAVGKFADFVILDKSPFDVAVTDIADIRITTTIVGDEPVFGVLPGATNFAGTPVPSITQHKENAVAITSMAQVTSQEELDTYEGLNPNSTILNAYNFEANVKDVSGNPYVGGIATFQMDLLGNGMAVSDIQVDKIISNTESKPYTYATDASLFADGTFWITEADTPRSALAENEILTENTMYMLHFAIADNGDYDANKDSNGEIKDPVTVSTVSGTVPSNNSAVETPVGGDSSSGGCTVGTTPQYDLMALLFVALGLIVVRTVRRKED